MPATEQQLYWYTYLVLKDRLEDINMLESIIKISTLHPCGTALFDTVIPLEENGICTSNQKVQV